MANLLDITVVPKVVKTTKFGDLNIHGLSITGLAYLIKKHPELFKMFDQEGKQKFEVDQLIDLGSEVLTDFICAGLGYPGGSEGYEQARKKVADNMNAEDAWSVCEAILEESFPGGAANFFERVTSAMNKAKVLKQDVSSNPSELKPKENQSQSQVS